MTPGALLSAWLDVGASPGRSGRPRWRYHHHIRIIAAVVRWRAVLSSWSRSPTGPRTGAVS